VAEVLPGPELEPGLEWVVSTLSAGTLLGEVKESTRRISELVAAVKSYSQLDRASVQPTDVTEGLESTLVMLKHRIPPGVSVVREYATDVPRIDAIAGELNQVWTNLIENAIDAMDGTGTLRVSAQPDGDGVLVEIIDTGSGMSAETQDHAFEPFFTTKGVGKGSGLGLSMVYGFVKQSGGHIEFETAKDRGTTFRLYLPASEQRPLALSAERSPRRLPGGHETILCVEDDAIVREFVTQQLRALGYKAIVVSNATDALTRVRSGVPIDLLFTDIIMPGTTDGWKLAELIRQIRPDIKVMYTTGYSDLSSERIGATKGIVLLEKPYRLSTLARMLRQALDEKPDVRKQATAPEAPQTRH